MSRLTTRRGVTTAAVVDGSFLLGSAGTFTRDVSVRINVGAFVNSDDESRRDSNGCWRSDVV